MICKSLSAANVLRYIARVGMLVLGTLVFLFALVSGAEAYGGGLYGVFRNAPNALPWALLLLLTALAWKRERLGGVAVTLFGMGLVIFFNLISYNFFMVTFIITTLVVVLGLFFVLSSYLRATRG